MYSSFKMSLVLPSSTHELLDCFLEFVPLMFSLLFHLKLWLTWQLFRFGIVLPVLLINAVINRTDLCHLLLVAFTIQNLLFNKWVKNPPLTPFHSKTVPLHCKIHRSTYKTGAVRTSLLFRVFSRKRWLCLSTLWIFVFVRL